MPGTHSPISRHLFTLDGMVLTSGGARNLSKGQFTIVDSSKAGANGAVVITNFAGQPDNTVYEMRLGKSRIPSTRTTMNSKPYSSQLFKIKDVVSVKANFPRFTRQTFDDLIIGYDGISADTAIDIDENMTTVLDVVLSGEHIGFRTGQKDYVIKLHFGKEVGETNEDVIRKVAKRLRETTLLGDIPLTEFVKVSVVDSNNPALTGTAYLFSTLTLTDEGDSNALSRVQAQYPAYEVVRTERSGLVSIYTILHPTASTLANYTSTTAATYIRNCEDCTAGYTEITGGVAYSVTIEDDGADLTTTVDDLPGFVTGSVIRQGDRDGRGLYTIILDNELTAAEIATYVTTAGVKQTATIELLGTVADVCSDVDTVSVAWVAGDTCYAAAETYTIQLADNECGESRLAELQAAYPELTIVEAPSTQSSRTVTLTGTSGTANITVAGTAYLATFATDLATTAANFVALHGAAINTATGATVTSNGAVITFTDATAGFPTIAIANATSNLAGTLGTVTAVPTTGGCQRVYSTTVVTDVACEECSDIFVDQFVSEAPADYEFSSWVAVEPAPDASALMGIRLTGKPFIFYPTEATRDMVPFYETSTRISVSGGYVEEVNQSFGVINDGIVGQFSDVFNIKRLSRAQDRDNLGAHLMQWEDAARAYFDGEKRHKGNLYAQGILGEESVLKFSSQYVSYEISVHDSKYSQGVGRTSDMGISYIVWAELGRQAALETYINKLAARAGVSGTNPI